VGGVGVTDELTEIDRIGNNEYSAEVVVGQSKNGTYRLHDIVNLTPTKIQRKISGTNRKSPEHSQGMTEESILKKQSMASAVDSLTGEKGNRYATDVSGDIPDARHRSAEYNGSIVSDNSISQTDGSVNTPYYSPSPVTSSAERVLETRRSAEANGISDEDISVFEKVAEEFGVSVRFYTADPTVEGDGFYEDGTIYLNTNAIDPIDVVFSHELSHHAERSGFYDSYKALALRELQKSTGSDLDTLIAEVTERYQRYGIELDRKGAEAKLVARFTQEYILGGSEELVRICNENVSLMQRVLDFFADFLEKIGVVNEGTRRIDRARRRLVEALRDSGNGSGNVGVSHMIENPGRTIGSDAKITPEDARIIKSVVHPGNEHTSINDLTSDEIRRTEPFARRLYRELGTKSPFFRAWFGDWRAYDTSQVKIVDTVGPLRSTGTKNKDTGWNIVVSRQVSKESSHQSGDSEKNAIKYLPYIIDITENAVLFDSYISNKDNPLSVMFHSMYVYTEALGYPAVLRLRVEELINEKDGSPIRRDYILQNIEEEPLSIGKRFSKAHHHEKDSSTISISDLFSFVKQYDTNFHPKEVSPYVLNDDGTPKVFYHQTEGDFTVFDTQREGAGSRDNETPYGIFLKTSDTDIGLRGKKQMPLYQALIEKDLNWRFCPNPIQP